MKVYLLEDNAGYGGAFTKGIFSTKQKAEEAAKLIKFYGTKFIIEFELDVIGTGTDVKEDD